MNPYLKHLNKIEFVVTDACTGRCKHCSAGAHTGRGERIPPEVAADAVRKIAAVYPIQTVMTVGGEPLLHPEAVCRIHAAACEMGVPRRQVITNGYFSGDPAAIRAMARRLADAGVNQLLLSVDAFHQETIPLDVVMTFAAALQEAEVPLWLQPAWLVSPEDENPYNNRTREILAAFAPLGIPTNQGNVVFPEGNALRYLAAYFTDVRPENPYIEDPADLRCVSFSANGDVLGGNIHCREITDLLREYHP